MEKRKFAFYSTSEFEHTVQVVASSPEEALEIAIDRCQAGAPGVFVDHFAASIQEIAPDGSGGRWWQLGDEGLVENIDGTISDLSSVDASNGNLSEELRQKEEQEF
jgi:hypothetical protein